MHVRYLIRICASDVCIRIANVMLIVMALLTGMIQISPSESRESLLSVSFLLELAPNIHSAYSLDSCLDIQDLTANCLPLNDIL